MDSPVPYVNPFYTQNLQERVTVDINFCRIETIGRLERIVGIHIAINE